MNTEDVGFGELWPILWAAGEEGEAPGFRVQDRDVRLGGPVTQCQGQRRSERLDTAARLTHGEDGATGYDEFSLPPLLTTCSVITVLFTPTLFHW